MYEKNLRSIIKQVSDSGKAPVIKSESNDIAAIKSWDLGYGRTGFIRIETCGEITIKAYIRQPSGKRGNLFEAISYKQLKLALKLAKIELDVSIGSDFGDKCNRFIDRSLCSGKITLNNNDQKHCPYCTNKEE